MTELMRALVYTAERTLEVCDLPVADPAPDEVLVVVEAAGICGSDLDAVATESPRRAPPLVMGHELTGQVVAAGGPAGRELVGRSAAINPQLPCGDCVACRTGHENICTRRGLIGGTRPGGFAERICVPVRCVHPYESELSPEVAVFAEPLATCVHALRFVPGQPLETAVVIGAGTIGVLVAQLLRVIGVELLVVCEIDPSRRQTMNSIADITVAPEELTELSAELTRGTGVELTVDAVGSESARRDSVAVLRAGGMALWVGMHEHGASICGFDLVVREQRIQGSFAYTDGDFSRALTMLRSGKMAPAVSTRTFSLATSAQVFKDLMREQSPGFVKAVISPEPFVGSDD